MVGNEVISDLVKIGIPSLVALAGTLSSLVLARWNNKQNILISELQHNYHREQERSDRTGELAKTCALNLSKLHDKFVEFGVIFFAKIETLSDGDPWLQPEHELITQRYQDALLSLTNHTEFKSYITLLGDDELMLLHQDYLSRVGALLDIYSQHGLVSVGNFETFMNEASASHLQLVKKLSDIFLLK